MTSTVTRYAEVYSEQYTDYVDVTSTLLGDRSSNNIIYFSMPASELILHPTYNSTITNLSLRIQEPVIGATASTTAEWMFTKDGITLSSSGWVGSYSYNYKAGLTLPVTWENAKTTGINRLSISIDPSSSLIRSQDYGTLYNTLWNPLIFDKKMTVTINGVNANVSFDGKTIIVSQTFIPKLNANAEMKTNIVCETGTSLEDIKAKLPNKVMVSTDMGNMWVPVSQWDITGYNPSVTGTYTAKGTFGFTSSTLSLNGFNGYVSASYQIVQGAVAVPTASVESGDYAQEKSVTLSAEDGAVIYYTLDGAAPTTDSSVYASALSMCGTAGESVTISAPDETSNNEQFVGWSVENSGGDIIAESNASSRTISFTMPQQAIRCE